MGAELIYQRRFSKKSADASSSAKRSKCVETSAKASLGGSGYGFHASLSGSMGSSNCEDESNENSFKHDESAEATRTITRGSRPVSLNQWINTGVFVSISGLDIEINHFE